MQRGNVFYLIIIILLVLVISICLFVAATQQHLHVQQTATMERRITKYLDYENGSIDIEDWNASDTIADKLSKLSSTIKTRMYYVDRVAAHQQYNLLVSSPLLKVVPFVFEDSNGLYLEQCEANEKLEFEFKKDEDTLIFCVYPGVLFHSLPAK